MKKIINASLLIFYCSFIFWLSSKPSIPAPMLFEHQDKIFHMGAYFIMGLLAWNFFVQFAKTQTFVFKISLCFCSCFGISDEWHQYFVPGRDADLLDWLADTLGAFLALLLMNLKDINFGAKKKFSHDL